MENKKDSKLKKMKENTLVQLLRGTREKRREDKQRDEDLKEQYKKADSQEKKINRIDKELEESNKKLKVEKNKSEEKEEEIKKLKIEVDKTKKQSEYRIEKYKKGIEGNEELKKELNKYQEEYNLQKEKGIYLGDLQDEIEKLKDENINKDKKREEDRKRAAKKEKANQKTINDYKSQTGRMKSVIKSNKKEEKTMEKQRVKLNRENKQIEMERKEFEKEKTRLRLALYNHEKNPENMLNILIKGLNKDTYLEYKRITTLIDRYRVVQKEIERENKKVTNMMGYIIKEGKEYYVISLEGKKAGKVINSYQKEYKEGTVCRASIYEDDEVIVKEIYGTEDNDYSNYKDENKTKIKKVTNNLNKENKLGYKFFEGVYKYDTVVITSKNIKGYRDYFSRYGVIDVIDPYSEGERKIRKIIDKADIIMVRPDATPHSVTDYLKDYYKEKTVFVTTTRKEDVAGKIYLKAKELDELKG